MQERLVILAGLRTPFCKAGTDLADMTADDLAVAVSKALLARTGIDPKEIDEAIFGCVGQPIEAANIARVIALRAGLPERTPAVTVHRNCASGAEAVTQAYEKMMAKRGDLFLVGGCESMSNYPLLFQQGTAEKIGAIMKAKTAYDRAQGLLKFRPHDILPRVALKLGLTDPVCGLNMGETAELIGREAPITREAMDRYALESHARAEAARERFAAEISPVYPEPHPEKGQSGSTPVVLDNGIRPHGTYEKLAKLSPIFERGTGTVTAGNSSQVTDGAVALLVASERKAAELGITPLGSLAGYAYAGCNPSRMGLGPVYAIDEAEKRTGFKLSDADLVEINEAFAAQVLACLHALDDPEFNREFLGRDTPIGAPSTDIVNVNGGAIALGHPVGATGARLVLTTLLELGRRSQHRAVVTACVGGGQGMALWLER